MSVDRALVAVPKTVGQGLLRVVIPDGDTIEQVGLDALVEGRPREPVEVDRQIVEATIDELGRFAEPRIRQALDAHGTSDTGRWLLDAAHQRP